MYILYMYIFPFPRLDCHALPTGPFGRSSPPGPLRVARSEAACESKHEEWELRVKLRTEETEGIDKALEILTSDSARELFATSIKPGVESFLQVASAPTQLLQDADSANAPLAKAYTALKVQVRQTPHRGTTGE